MIKSIKELFCKEQPKHEEKVAMDQESLIDNAKKEYLKSVREKINSCMKNIEYHSRRLNYYKIEISALCDIGESLEKNSCTEESHAPSD